MRYLIVFLLLAGCSTIDQLNSNMQNANEIMFENIHTMEASKAAIEENTKQIERSTQNLEHMEFVALILFGIVVILALILIIVLIVRRRRKSK